MPFAAVYPNETGVIFPAILPEIRNPLPLSKMALFRYNERNTSKKPMGTQTQNLHLVSNEQKAAAKAALQERLGWPVELKRAMICIPTGLTESTGGNLFEEVLPGLLTLPVQLCVLGKGSEHYGRLCTKLSKERPHQVAIIPSKSEQVEEMLRASDMALLLNPSEKDFFNLLSRYGIVPVSVSCDGVTNYNPNQESGTGFVYEGETHWHCFGALIRAMETYRFPFDWKTIQRNGLEMID